MYTIHQNQPSFEIIGSDRPISAHIEEVKPAPGGNEPETGEKTGGISRMKLYCGLTQILRQCGVPANLCGYEYIREAVILDYFTPGYRHAVTKALYPKVAAAFASTPSRVERAMRHAIEVTWTRGDAETLQKFFGRTVSGTKGKPTNSEFIAAISDYLRTVYPMP